MKKSLLALAVLGAVAGTASAQVTLSGGVDLGVVKKLGNTLEQTAGKSARSNLTFSGKEDLGSDMSAYFGLNLRFNPENGTTNPGSNPSYPGNATAAAGQGTQIFRNSWVGLNTKAGSIQLGRFLVPFQELNGNYDAFGTDTVGSVHANQTIDGKPGMTANVRINSAVEYRSPVLGGFQVLLLTADSNAQGSNTAVAAAPATATSFAVAAAPATKTKRPFGASISFNQGPISLAVATDRTAYDDGSAKDEKTTGAYGSFTFPTKAKVMFQYEKYAQGAASAAAGVAATGVGVKAPATVKRFSISAKIPVNQFDLKAGYLRGKDEDFKKIGLGVDYNLSKRTQLYTDFAKVSGSGFGGSKITDLPQWTADKATKAQFDIGIFHKF